MDSFIYNLTKSPVSLWHFIPLGKGAGGSAPYGICRAPDCFQQQLDHCLEGLKGVYRIADDLLIIGQEDTDEKAVLDHDQKPEEPSRTLQSKKYKAEQEVPVQKPCNVIHWPCNDYEWSECRSWESWSSYQDGATSSWCNSSAEIHWASEVPVQVPTRPIRNVWAIVDIEHFIKLLNLFIQSFPVSACIVVAL